MIRFRTSAYNPEYFEVLTYVHQLGDHNTRMNIHYFLDISFVYTFSMCVAIVKSFFNNHITDTLILLSTIAAS